MTFQTIATKIATDRITPADLQALHQDLRQEVITPAAKFIAPGVVTSIAFTNISQSFEHLFVVCHLRTSLPTATTGWLRFNNDAVAANYFTQIAQGYSSANFSASEVIGATHLGFAVEALIGSNEAGLFNNSIIFIPYYKSVNHKPILILGGRKDGLAGVGAEGVAVIEYTTSIAEFGLWKSTAAINRIDLLGSTLTANNNLAEKSYVALYGIGST